MSDMIRGMVVYHRTTSQRGTITAGNQFTGIIAVSWDDGTRELTHVTNLMSEKLYNETKEQERLDAMGLKISEAIVGATVYQMGKNHPLTQGKIAGPMQGQLALVEWESGHISRVDVKHLLNDVDGNLENQRLLDEKNKLEEEFANVEEACKAKLQQAADLITEAAVLAESKGQDLQEMYEATSVLRRAMGDAGWQTSSWSC